MPAQYNLDFWIGNDITKQFTFKNADNSAVDLTGSTLVFRAVKSDGIELFRKDLVITAPATGGIATLTLSAAETRNIPLSVLATYEIERRIGGSQTTLLYGNVTGIGGINDD